MPYVRVLSLSVLMLAATATWAQPKESPKGPKLPDGATVDRDVAYGSHERQKLDVYMPKGDGPFPCLLWVHGGAWEGGSKEDGNPALGLLPHGYVVASTNYRLSKHAPFPAQIYDVKG